VRLIGTNDAEARRMLEGSPLRTAVTMDEVVQRRSPQRAGGGMSILADRNSRVVVQGITGRDRRLSHQAHARLRDEDRRRRDAGRRAAPMCTACRSSTASDRGAADRRRHSVIYVPPLMAADAICEAVAAGSSSSSASPRHPVLDMMRVLPFVRENGARLLGPELPRSDRSGAVQDRHPAGQHRAPRPDRCRVAQRHAHL
jgi:hypothetical protein